MIEVGFAITAYIAVTGLVTAVMVTAKKLVDMHCGLHGSQLAGSTTLRAHAVRMLKWDIMHLLMISTTMD